MSRCRLFITGATGCVGQYLVDRLAEEAEYELHLLVRAPGSLRLPTDARARIEIHEGSLDDIERLAATISAARVVIHVATAWDDSDWATAVNLDRTLALAACCARGGCERFLYFSTASILGRDHAPDPVAGRAGTGYIRSKFLAHQALQASPVADRLVTLFPTLVFGGDATHRYSHIAREATAHPRLMGLARFVRAQGRFHFMHARDIATIVAHLVEHEPAQREIVLGQRVVEFDEAIRAVSEGFGRPYRGWLEVSPSRIFLGARMLGITLSDWDRHCLASPFFEYRASRPEDFGLASAFPTFQSVVADLRRSIGE